MQHQITYKDHTIILDGIVAKLFYKNELIHKVRFVDALEVTKNLKAFITLRTNQLNKEKGVNIYV